jgi:Lrp/AsnC family leucine-responsive transcriptional regulator
MVAFVFVETQEAARRTAVAESLARVPAIQEIHFIAGPDRFLIKLRVAGPEELNRLLQDDIGPIPGIARTCTHVVLDTLKETANIPLGEEA